MQPLCAVYPENVLEYTFFHRAGNNAGLMVKRILAICFAACRILIWQVSVSKNRTCRYYNLFFIVQYL